MISKNVSEREMLAKADNVFLSLELVVLALFIIGLLSSSAVQINAAKIILSGPYAPFFWVFVICTGIVIPLFIQILAVSHKIRHTSVAPLLVLLGGLLLRFVIVYAGQYSEWTTTTLLK
jgi:formate-dependent nitrite reductase membrane component NrfD